MTPDEPSIAVANGARFQLHEQPDRNWLDESPPLPVGTTPGALTYRGRPLRVTMTTKEESWTGLWQNELRRTGWAVPVGARLIVPLDLVPRTGGGVGSGSSGSGSGRASLGRFEVGGAVFAGGPLSAGDGWRQAGLALLGGAVPTGAGPAGVSSECRVATSPEDCVLLDDRLTELPLQRDRLQSRDGRWYVDAALSIGPSWHGAPVVSQTDGRLIGIMCRPERGARWVAPLPELPE
jgi:hypothetical protein